jgi:YD repeat-containing protein
MPDWQRLAFVAVPGGLVNVAGGNLVVRKDYLSIDTQLGSNSISATYNSTAGNWMWSFDVSFDGTTFVDSSGASYPVSGLLPGDPIPGTIWVLRSNTQLKTKGGSIYTFDANGRLARIRWSSSPYPRIVFTSQMVSGALHTTKVEQCLDAADCRDVYDVAYDAEGRVDNITDRAGRTAAFTYYPDGLLETARTALEVAEAWPGYQYEYSGTQLTAITNSEGERIEIDYAGPRVQAVRPIGEENPVYGFAYGDKLGSGHFQSTYTNPLGFATTFEYDGQGRVWWIDNALAERVSYSWSGNRITQQTSPSGVTTSWTYLDDDVATETQPSGNLLVFTYEPNGVNRENPAARPILRIEDDLGLVEERTYDVDGRLETVSNGERETTTITYRANEMIKTVTSPAGVDTTHYGHGNDGHPNKLISADVRQHGHRRFRRLV